MEPVKSDLYKLCGELRLELDRHGVRLPALMPLAELEIDPPEWSAQLIWLGTCRVPVARRLLATLRSAAPPEPRPDLSALVREANARSEQNRAIKGGGGLSCHGPESP
ncbi:hypothetical protein [Streptomyces mayteni]